MRVDYAHHASGCMAVTDKLLFARIQLASVVSQTTQTLIKSPGGSVKYFHPAP